MEWKHLFKPEIVGRGLSYYRLGRVQNLEQIDGEIKAEVIGNDTYSVWIKYGKKNVEAMKCSCPYAQSGKNCKHMVAVIVAGKSLLSEEPAEQVA